MDGITLKRNASALIELRPRSQAGMFAVLFRGRRRRNVIPLVDGTIVEAPTPDQRCEVPASLESCLGITADRAPATIHHSNLGLVHEYIALNGIYVLPSGEVAAVYGAQSAPLG